MTPEAKHNLVAQGMMAAPSLGAIATYIAGITIEKCAAVAGLLFILAQTVGYLWRLRRDMRHERERIARGEPPPDSRKGGL